jgi:hypothetical protein
MNIILFFYFKGVKFWLRLFLSTDPYRKTFQFPYQGANNDYILYFSKIFSYYIIKVANFTALEN